MLVTSVFCCRSFAAQHLVDSFQWRHFDGNTSAAEIKDIDGGTDLADFVLYIAWKDFLAS